MKKTIFTLLGTTFLAIQAQAGLSEGILAYNYQQYPAALEEFSYLKDEGDPVAAYYLGRMYHLGQGVPQNLGAAASLYRMADSGYYFPAATELGKIMIENNQFNEGIRLLRKAALVGDVEAAHELAELYVEGKGVERNLNYAFAFYKIAALGGHMKAQYQLGKMYLDGRGIPQDYEKALKWIGRAANQGYLLAQIDLAEISANDERLKNLAVAYQWYSLIYAYNGDDEIGKRAKEKRDILLKGNKLRKNTLEKIQKNVGEWKRKTPEESVPLSEIQDEEIPIINDFNDVKTLQKIIFQEGFLPRNGKVFGITDDLVDEAIATQDVHILVEQIEKAQKNGQNGAYGYLGDLFKTRLNNLPEAFLWYQKGAEAGDIYSQYQLALMYCDGSGISQPDASECYAWLLQVQQAQDPMYAILAQNALNVVRSSATKEELELGKAKSNQLGKNPSKSERKTKKSGINLLD